MPVTFSQYRGTVGGFDSLFVFNKQYNFFYTDYFRKLIVSTVSSFCFLVFKYVLMKY